MYFGVTEIVLIVIMLAVVAVPITATGFLMYRHMKERASLKTCPYCAEKINMAAIVCRFCQRQIA